MCLKIRCHNIIWDKNRAYTLVILLIFKPSNTPFNEIFSHFLFLCPTFHFSVCIIYSFVKICVLHRIIYVQNDNLKSLNITFNFPCPVGRSLMKLTTIYQTWKPSSTFDSNFLKCISITADLFQVLLFKKGVHRFIRCGKENNWFLGNQYEYEKSKP